MATQPYNPQEEVDLGNLFSQLGRAFNNLFKSIGNLIKTLFHYGIISILFLRKYALILGGMALIGGVIGFFLDKDKTPLYKTSVIVKTNYGSAKELYHQQGIINNLINTGSFERLAEILKISKEDAKKIKEIDVNPFEKVKNISSEYNYNRQRRDTNYIKDFEFKSFLGTLKISDLRYHSISVISTDSSSPPQLSIGFKNLIETDYYKSIRDKTIDELQLKRKTIENNLKEVDSIHNAFRKAAILSAKNQGTIGTTQINLFTEKKDDNKNIFTLFDVSNELLAKLENIKPEEERAGSIVTIVSDFNKGMTFNPLVRKKSLLFALMGFSIALLSILLFLFNKYLNNYEKNLA